MQTSTAFCSCRSRWCRRSFASHLRLAFACCSTMDTRAPGDRRSSEDSMLERSSFPGRRPALCSHATSVRTGSVVGPLTVQLRESRPLLAAIGIAFAGALAWFSQPSPQS